jgi:hypothetical protein
MFDAPRAAPGQSGPAQLRQHLDDGILTERTEVETLQARPLDRADQGRGAVRSLGEQKEDRLVAKTTHGERERLRGGAIEPGRLVHGDEEAAARRQRAQRAQQGDRDRVRARRRAARLVPQERHLEGAKLGRRQAGQLPDVQLVEQVGQRRERQLRLALAGSGREHPEPAALRDGDAGLPERGLADAGRPGDDERACVPIRA